LVLIHEMGGSLESWRSVGDLLTDEFAVLSYDQRGAGWSEKPPGPIEPTDHVDDLEQVLQAVGWSKDLFIAGAAAGSSIAVGYALRHPGAVVGLALCVASIESSPTQLAAAEERAETVRRDGMRGLEVGALAAIYPEDIREEGFVGYRARWLAHDPRAFAELNVAFGKVDLDPGQVQVPCLVLAGDRDRTRPPEAAAAVASRFPQGQWERVPRAGHVMAVQAPQEVAAHLRRFFTNEQR
jgi:3-oxoadipate enol-lactonase